MSSDWEMKSIGELVTHRKGFAFKSKDYLESGVPVVRVTNFTDNSISPADLKFVSPLIATANNNVSLKVNDIVIATVGSWPNNPASVVGRTILVPKWAENALMNQNSVILRSQTKTDQRFIYYQMKSPAFASHIISKAQGSANQASITLDAIFSYQLNWPNDKLRKYIADTLATIDDRITLLRETNTTLEAIAQALFKSWFVDFDPVRAKQEGREPEGMDAATAALFPDSFEESGLGLVPVGWNNLPFTDSVHVIGGGTPKTTVPEYWNGDIPWFSVVDAPTVTDVFVIDTQKHITEKGLNNSSTKLLAEGTTIISARGTVGRLALVGRQMAMNQSCYGLRGKAGDSFFTYFSTYRLVESLKQRSHGSVFDTITTETMKGVFVIYPDKAVVVAFETLLQPVMERIQMNLEQAQTLATLRDTLLPRLISGQLRLPDTEATHEAANA